MPDISASVPRNSSGACRWRRSGFGRSWECPYLVRIASELRVAFDLAASYGQYSSVDGGGRLGIYSESHSPDNAFGRPIRSSRRKWLETLSDAAPRRASFPPSRCSEWGGLTLLRCDRSGQVRIEWPERGRTQQKASEAPLRPA